MITSLKALLLHDTLHILIFLKEEIEAATAASNREANYSITLRRCTLGFVSSIQFLG